MSESSPLTSPEISLEGVTIPGGFWAGRQRLNSAVSIYHQWEQMEKTGRLDNFRKAAGLMEGDHKGFFYNDSDVHKWAEAGYTILAGSEDNGLKKLLSEYADLVISAQEADGYLFTYNQLNFSGQRWINLQIEHELYTLGHFIEAGIAALLYASDDRLFSAAQKAADLIVDVFLDAAPIQTPGHQEVEIALLRLFDVTRENRFLEMARQFLEKRGRTRFFGFHLLRQFVNQTSRSGQIARQQESNGEDPKLGFDISENLSDREPRFIGLRSNLQFLSGKYHQQHCPIRKMTEPVGHSVRWAYLQAAVAMLCRQTKDRSLLTTLEKAWDAMVREKTYVTGGIGSLPVVEGFGRPFELDNEFAYAETCAAIACIFWNWQMALATGDARYAELIEWQLYNASAVGLAQDGRGYSYRNPLLSNGDPIRKPWFDTACCPGNIARLWAHVGRYIASTDEKGFLLHQYIDSNINLPVCGSMVKLEMKSGFPWEGSAVINLSVDKPTQFRLKLRIPGWAKQPSIIVAGAPISINNDEISPVRTAGGYSPFEGRYIDINKTWNGKTTIELQFNMSPTLHHPHARVTSNNGMVSVSRGPVVYCLEDIDNPSANIPDAVLVSSHPIQTQMADDPAVDVVRLEARDINGNPLIFIPYYCWANRKTSKMQVWVKESLD